MRATCFATLLLAVPAVSFAVPRTLVPDEGQVEFVVREMGVPVPGRFKKFDAVIDIDPAVPEKSIATVRIDVGSLSTGNEEADALAVGPEWLDKARAPYAVFKSTAIREVGKGRFEVKGALSIRNVSRDLTIQFTASEGAGGKTTIASEFVIKRSDFGIGGGVWNQPGVVAEEIPVKARFTLAAPAPARSAAR